MMLRRRIQLASVAISLVAAVLCAVQRAPVLATVCSAAAIVIWRLRFGSALDAQAIEPLLVRLGEQRQGAMRGSRLTTPATVTTLIVVMPKPGALLAFAFGGDLAFRDEISPPQWRKWVTLLRHQPHPARFQQLTLR